MARVLPQAGYSSTFSYSPGFKAVPQTKGLSVQCARKCRRYAAGAGGAATGNTTRFAENRYRSNENAVYNLNEA